MSPHYILHVALHSVHWATLQDHVVTMHGTDGRQGHPRPSHIPRQPSAIVPKLGYVCNRMHRGKKEQATHRRGAVQAASHCARYLLPRLAGNSSPPYQTVRKEWSSTIRTTVKPLALAASHLSNPRTGCSALLVCHKALFQHRPKSNTRTKA